MKSIVAIFKESVGRVSAVEISLFHLILHNRTAVTLYSIYD